MGKVPVGRARRPRHGPGRRYRPRAQRLRAVEQQKGVEGFSHEERYLGSLLGLALGDAFLAPREGGLAERLLWQIIGRTLTGQKRWTDDTQMSLDLAQSLIFNRDLNLSDAASRFARSYHWSRGYGPGAAKTLKKVRAGMAWREANRSVYPDGSFGNGGAMRAPVVGLYFANRSECIADKARQSASVTHAHPQAQEGAALIAVCTAAALTKSDPEEILAAGEAVVRDDAIRRKMALARRWLLATKKPDIKEVGAQLGSGMAAVDSCVTAAYLALIYLRAPFPELLVKVRQCGGDVDTIGAMAGAIWGAANGVSALPRKWLRKLERRHKITRIAKALFQASPTT